MISMSPKSSGSSGSGLGSGFGSSALDTVTVHEADTLPTVKWRVVVPAATASTVADNPLGVTLAVRSSS
ncbi:hypothetical protein, partial [Tannerella forsythia]|uniref:hypothetical protein n=1 Tax=Tannerella forsythia TaxID=28112 RepID=UPI00211C6077